MRKVLLAAVLFLTAASAHANATFSGSIGFATPALVEADASPTGNINTATAFTLQGFSTTENVTGVFSSLPIQDFGTVTFMPGVDTSLDFSDGPFGKFASTKITSLFNNNGFLNLLITGTWTAGTFETGLTGKSFPAAFRASLTQTPPTDGEISFSATMSAANVGVVPEPPTMLLFMSGIGMILLGSRLRNLLGLN